MDGKKILIMSAPSGSGKTTITRHLLQTFPELEFSVSATSRAPRDKEIDGKDYYFLTPEKFEQKVKNSDFVEWEEVYPGSCYGTLRSEVERIWSEGRTAVFDVDVKGGLKIKEIFGKNALSVFVMPPSIAELEKRLAGRGTESAQAIAKRIGKAREELEYAPRFDAVLVNDDLQTAFREADEIVGHFING